MGDQPTPNWDVIKQGLKSLFVRYDVDLSAVGQSQRLTHNEFETIFYHLFKIIDPAECRRKFWSIYPAKNPEERSHFINNTALLINTKTLTAQRISASQLRMRGGEPFRRIVTSLIMKAVELETVAIERTLVGEGEQYQLPEHSLADYCYEIDKEREKLRAKLNDLSEASQKFEHDQQVHLDLKQEVQEKLTTMGIKLSLDNDSDIESNKKAVFKSLLSELEKSMKSRESTKKTIATIVSKTVPTSKPGNISLRHENSRRLSEYFVNIRRCLGESPQYSPNTNKSMLIDKITQRLIDHETGLDEICSGLQIMKERSDGAYLDDPEMQERYKSLEKLIPYINLKPIDLEGDGSGKEINMNKLREILVKYPDERGPDRAVYNDNELLEHFEKNILL